MLTSRAAQAPPRYGQTSLPEVRLTRTEHAVLGLLAWAGESSGYDLRHRADRSLGFIWTPVRSHLYTVLPRLAATGLSDVQHVRQRGKPDKQLHRINDAGLSALEAWLSTVEPIEPDDRDGLLLKVFFARFGPAGALDLQLADFRERSVMRLQTYREIEQEINASGDAAGDPYPLFTLQLGIALTEANISWVDETLARLASPNVQPGAQRPSDRAR